MSTIAVGASQTFNLGDGQNLEIATNGGFYSISLTPNLTGKTTTSVQGPGAHAHTFGPYAGGAVLILGNQTVDTFTVVQPPALFNTATGEDIFPAGTSTPRSSNRPRLRMAAIGDSRFANAIQNQTSGGITKINWSNQGALFWLNFFTNQQILFQGPYDLAISGYTTTQIAALVPNVLALSPQPNICLINGGTNDFSATQSLAAIATALSNIIGAAKQLRGYGIIPIIEVDTPRTVGSWGANAQKCSIAYNHLLRQACRDNGIRVADSEAAYLATSGDPVTGYNVADGIHSACTGAIVRALALQSAVADLLPGTNQSTGHILDTYDATYNPYGNLLTNGLMTGTGGTNSGAGASGSVPTSWTHQVVSGTCTSVCSKESPRSDGKIGDRAVITISATTACQVRLAPSTALATNISAGDSLYGSNDLEITALTGGVDNVWLNVFDNTAGGQQSTSVAGKQTFGTGLNPLPVLPLSNNTGSANLLTSLKGRLQTLGVVLGQNGQTTGVPYRIEANLAAGATLTFKVGDCRLEKQQ